MTTIKLSAPFPWFGGKSRAASLIWSRLGTVGNYVEPFLGSAAVWLNRPSNFSGWAVLNDLDGNVANFWRATKADPEAVATAANWPVNECDLHAKHLYLVNLLPKLSARLMADPEYFDARAAGWWAWGACSWIGSGWCDGSGPWSAVPDPVDGIPVFQNFKQRNPGKCVLKKLPHLGNAGRGVNRQLPHLCNGRGVNRQLPHLGNGQGVNKTFDSLLHWFHGLRESLRPARITCGDWLRIMSLGTITRNGPAGVVLDPPYSQTEAVYATDSSTVAHDVRQWAAENGDNPALRIALCGHAGEHESLEGIGWIAETWDKPGGYQGKDDRERIWFSPHCIKKPAELFDNKQKKDQ